MELLTRIYDETNSFVSTFRVGAKYVICCTVESILSINEFTNTTVDRI